VLDVVLPFAWVVVVLVPGQPEELTVFVVVTFTTACPATAAALCAGVSFWTGIVLSRWGVMRVFLNDIIKNKTRKNSRRFFL